MTILSCPLELLGKELCDFFPLKFVTPSGSKMNSSYGELCSLKNENVILFLWGVAPQNCTVKCDFKLKISPKNKVDVNRSPNIQSFRPNYLKRLK